MKLLRLFLFGWLSLALSGSGWAFAPVDCATPQHDHLATTDMAAHAESRRDVQASSGPGHAEHHGHHGATVPDGVEVADAASDCECCETCMTSCAFSLAAMTSQCGAAAPIFGSRGVNIGSAAQRAPPPPYPLLRPPIPTV